MFPFENLNQMLEGVAQSHAAKNLHFPTLSVSMSLEALAARARRLAGVLAEEDVGRGSTVGLLLPNSPGFVVGYFGILGTGAAVSPLPQPAPLDGMEGWVERLGAILAAGEVRFVLASDEWAAALDGVAARLGVKVLRYEALASRSAPEPVRSVGPDDLAMVQYTSGSTAVPKGVPLSHANVLAGIAAIIEGAKATPEDRQALWLPLFHDMGLIGMLSGIALGAEQRIYSPASFIRNPARWLEDASRHGTTIYSGPNFSYAYLVDTCDEEQVRRLDLSRLRVCFNGAEPIDPALLDRFAAHFAPAGFRKEALFPVYGMAEATLAVTFPEVGTLPAVEWIDRRALVARGQAWVVDRDHPHARGVVSVGSAVKGLEVRVLGPSGEVAADGAVGEIVIRGASVTRGYHRAPEVNRAAFADGWFHTGDLGYQRAGRLYITGRKKQMIIVRGANHYPEDLEAASSGIDGIYRGRGGAVGRGGHGDARVAGRVGGTRRDPAARPGLLEQVRQRVATRLGAGAVDVFLVQRNTLRRTSSGKLQRVLMRELLTSGRLEANITARLEQGLRRAA